MIKCDFKAELDKNVLSIYDYIDKCDGCSSELVRTQIDDLEQEKPLDIYINSCGGDVFEGYTIFNLLSRYKGRKTVYIDGIAASIASVIAMAGDWIVMNKLSQIMIHNASTGCYGTADEMMKTAETLKGINEQLNSVYQAKTNLSYEDIKEMMDNETYLTSSEALEKGFCNEVVDFNKKNTTIQNRKEILNKLKEVENFLSTEEKEDKNESTFFNTKNSLKTWLKEEK